MAEKWPLARTDALIIKEFADETLVYDLTTDKAHCLNLTAAQVWKACNGERTIAELCEFIEAETGSSVKQEMVWLALDQLETFKLLDNAPVRSFQLTGMSRRSLVKRIGIAALALPVIISISAPSAQAQGSLLAPGACCGNPSQCQSNSCNQNPTCVGVPAPSTKACA